MREKDIALGGFFSTPVDPVALGIPTYPQIIKEPMDLGTIARRMELNEVESPEEFARLCRLVFENAMKFNVDPAHSVHQAARNLLIQFNQKFRDIERMIQNFRRTQGDDKKDSKKSKKKEPIKPKTIREIRFEEAQSMATASAETMANLIAAAPNNSALVSRSEFSLLLRMIQQMQSNISRTYRLLASLSPDEVEAQPTVPDQMSSSVSMTSLAPAVAAPAPRSAPAPERKKPQKRKAEVFEQPAVLPDVPLTREEQELLTETINDLPAEHLGGVIQIIREAAPVGADEDEIDLDIDQLSYSTQRKLLHHVSKVSFIFLVFVGHFIHITTSSNARDSLSRNLRSLPRKRKRRQLKRKARAEHVDQRQFLLQPQLLQRRQPQRPILRRPPSNTTQAIYLVLVTRTATRIHRMMKITKPQHQRPRRPHQVPLPKVAHLRHNRPKQVNPQVVKSSSLGTQ